MKKEYVELLRIAREKYQSSNYGAKEEEIKSLNWYLGILGE